MPIDKRIHLVDRQMSRIEMDRQGIHRFLATQKKRPPGMVRPNLKRLNTALASLKEKWDDRGRLPE